jgi:hypothetical protein
MYLHRERERKRKKEMLKKKWRQKEERERYRERKSERLRPEMVFLFCTFFVFSPLVFLKVSFFRSGS